MRQLKYRLETEQKLSEINEIDYEKRALLKKAENIIRYGAVFGKNKGRALIKEQRPILLDYLEDMIANFKVKSHNTIYNNIMAIYRLGLAIPKPFSMIDSKDLKKYFANKRMNTNSQASISVQLAMVKKFFKWLYSLEDEIFLKRGEYPEPVRWICCSIKRTGRVLDESSLLSHEEIADMIRACDDERDSCFVSVMYEGALRLSETINIHIKDIVWGEDGSEAKIRVSGKTGERVMLYIDSVPHLKRLLRAHHERNNPNAPLFINKASQFGRRIGKPGAGKIISRASKRANVKKRVYPHLLRHSRLHYLSRYCGFNEMQLRFFAGWQKTSDMPSIYLHYNMENVYDTIRNVKGKVENSIEAKRLQQEKILRSVKCPKCESENPSTNIMCDECGSLFELSKREQFDKKLNLLFSDSEFKDLVKDYLKKKALDKLEVEVGRNE